MRNYGYKNGEEAIQCMRSCIEWIQENRAKQGIKLFKESYRDELNMIREKYHLDRLGAMSFGMDVNMFPRRLHFNTKLPK